MSSKLSEYGKTIWSHKKKIIFFSGLGGWAFSYLNRLNNEQIVRSSYARKAERIGATTIGPINTAGTYVPPKLHVFVDKSDSLYLKNLASFQKNVLPLLELAGIDVRMTNAADSDELRLLTKSADVRNSIGVVLVGSRRYALPAVLSGIFYGHSTSKDQPRTHLAVFDPADRDDVNALFEKAMRIVNGQRESHHVYSTEVYTKDSEGVLIQSNQLRIADLNFGWFEFCRERESKFWWFGPLSERIAFTWYFLKNYPQPMSLLLKYQERCQGCRRCVTEAPIDSNTANNSQKWWQLFIGRKEQPGDENRRKYAKVLNENCGKTVEVQLDAVDLLIRNLDEGVYGGLGVCAIDAFPTRWKAISQIWTSWNKKESPENFFSEKFPAQSIEVKVLEPISESIVKSKAVESLDENSKNKGQLSKIIIENIPKIIQMY